MRTKAEYLSAVHDQRLVTHLVGVVNTSTCCGSAQTARRQIADIERFGHYWSHPQWEIANFLFGRIVWERVEQKTTEAYRYARVTVLDNLEIVDVVFYVRRPGNHAIGLCLNETIFRLSRIADYVDALDPEEVKISQELEALERLEFDHMEGREP